MNQSHSVVCYGEVLWDILPTGPLPGGAPMNVAYHLNQLGCNPALITKIGIDEWGRKLLNGLAAQGVCTDYFYVDYEVPTGLVYAKPNEHNEVTYDIVQPSAWDHIEWNPEMEALACGAEYLVFGSLTSRNKTSRETLYRLLDCAKTKVLDINLRVPHFQRDSITSLLNRADILKMNGAELELITGWFSRFNSLEDRIRLMQERFGIATIIVTLGGDGAMGVENGIMHRHSGYPVQVADTIGSGDAFLAGFLSQQLKGKSIDEALQFACGMGAFIATQSGACPDYEVRQVEELMSKSNQNNNHPINNSKTNAPIASEQMPLSLGEELGVRLQTGAELC